MTDRQEPLSRPSIRHGDSRSPLTLSGPLRGGASADGINETLARARGKAPVSMNLPSAHIAEASRHNPGPGARIPANPQRCSFGLGPARAQATDEANPDRCSRWELRTFRLAGQRDIFAAESQTATFRSPNFGHIQCSGRPETVRHWWTRRAQLRPTHGWLHVEYCAYVHRDEYTPAMPPIAISPLPAAMLPISAEVMLPTPTHRYLHPVRHILRSRAQRDPRPIYSWAKRSYYWRLPEAPH